MAGTVWEEVGQVETEWVPAHLLAHQSEDGLVVQYPPRACWGGEGARGVSRAL